MKKLFTISVAAALALGLGAGKASADDDGSMSYAAKFTCGTVEAKDLTQPVLGEATYLTAINIHNPNGYTVTFVKRLQEAAASRKPERDYPWTQQDIVEVAVKGWLDEQGH